MARNRVLDNLHPPRGATKKRKRVGCGPGSGHGKTSCRGHKGAGQRKGKEFDARFEGGQMPLYRHIPKRGFHNIFKQEFQIVNVGNLTKFQPNTNIDIENLVSAGLVRQGYPVKILGEGEINVALNITAHAFSKSAKAKIEKAGGKIETIKEETRRK